MRPPTRLSLIAVCLVLLSVPLGGACEMMGQWMKSCAMAAPHAMADCGGETALAASCCDAGTLDAITDLVLNRPDEGAEALADAGYAVPWGPPAVDALRLRASDPAPPPQTAPFRLFSALLL